MPDMTTVGEDRTPPHLKPIYDLLFGYDIRVALEHKGGLGWGLSVRVVLPEGRLEVSKTALFLDRLVEDVVANLRVGLGK